MMKNDVRYPVPALREPLRMVFMGTPDFAAASLAALGKYAERTGAKIVGVFTREDKPAGRGHKLTPPPVKVLAEKMGVPVFQPKTLRAPEPLEILRTLAPNLIVVAAYGRILPPEVLELPACGCINVHGSLLPEYRGAAPMQRAVIDGKKVTGITTMYMNDGIDTGDMLLVREVPIGDEDDFGTVHDRMAEVGAELLTETLDALTAGTLVRTPQPEEGGNIRRKARKRRPPHRLFTPRCGAARSHTRVLARAARVDTYTGRKAPQGRCLTRCRRQRRGRGGMRYGA